MNTICDNFYSKHKNKNCKVNFVKPIKVSKKEKLKVIQKILMKLQEIINLV